jgi:hypothetical protein
MYCLILVLLLLIECVRTFHMGGIRQISMVTNKSLRLLHSIAIGRCPCKTEYKLSICLVLKWGICLVLKRSICLVLKRGICLVLKWSICLVMKCNICLVLKGSICLVMNCNICLVLKWSICLVLKWSICLSLKWRIYLELLICSDKQFLPLNVASNLLGGTQCFGGANSFHL